MINQRIQRPRGDPSANLLERLLSIACYLGLGPLIRPWKSRASSTFWQHHHTQAMAALFLVLVLFCALLLLDLGEWGLLIFVPGVERHLESPWVKYLAYVSLVPILAVVALWLALLGLALAGSSWRVPLLRRLVQCPRIVRIAAVVNVLGLALLPSVAAFAFYTTSLTQRSVENAAVHFLYDEGIPVPRCGYALGLYRVARQADLNWGKGSVVLDRLNKQTLRAALAHAKVVILATHGGRGYACTFYAPEKLAVAPAGLGVTDESRDTRFLRTCVLGTDNKWGKWENVRVGRDVRLVYIFGCHAGIKASEWQEHLAPAQVITYSRLSSVFDHGLWFAFTGPAQVKRLQANESESPRLATYF